ncbi:MAG: hypothetical protein EOO88_58270 [Pedobacter sp.]|nr:MAG: hypothetical protein EOO88_58270 [Pedobacter sp.]
MRCIKYDGLKTTHNLISGRDTLSFVYTLYNVHHKAVATAGSGEPGTMKETMDTFGSFPYLIENDSVLVYEDRNYLLGFPAIYF